MKPFARAALLLLATTLLTRCAGPAEDGRELVSGARSATVWTLRVAGMTSRPEIRPSALIGAYVTEYLVHTSVFQSAIAGIEAQMQLFFDDEFEEDESFALLEDLGSLLQVNIMDMLNRSTDRPAAFDAYVDTLTDLGQRAEGRLARLEQELDDVQTERREQRRETSIVQRSLNEAIREQNYSAASGLQRQIIEEEAELARVEAEEDEIRSVIRLYEDLLEIADERLAAMRQNREPLIAGLRVVDVPGIDDLGLIEEGMRGRRRGSAFDELLIDPSL